jgi:hypothetical protein
MDDPVDFKMHALELGDLVQFTEFKYHPDIYTDKTIIEGSTGIVVKIEKTHMGYLVHHIAWLKEDLVIATPRANLKLVYLKK